MGDITGPQIRAQAPPEQHVQIIPGKQNVYQGVFANLLGNVVGSGFEHLMRQWLPSPQDEMTKVQMENERAKLEGPDWDRLRRLQTRREKDPENAATYTAEMEEIAKRRGISLDQVSSTPEYEREMQAFDSFNKSAGEAQAYLNPTAQQQVQQSPAAPPQDNSFQGPAPEPQQVDVRNNPVANEPKQMGPPYAQSQLSGEPVAASPVSLPPVTQEPVQQSQVALDPNTRQGQAVANGFAYPQPQPLSSDEQLKRSWAQKTLLASAEAMRMIATGRGEGLFDKNNAIMDVFDHSVTAYSQIYRSMLEKEYSVKPEFARHIDEGTLAKIIAARQAVLTGDPKAQEYVQSAERAKQAILMSPEFANDPWKQANMQAHLLQAADGYTRFAQAAGLPADTAVKYAEVQRSNTQNLATVASIGEIRQRIENMKTDNSLNKVQLSYASRLNDAKLLEADAQVSQMQAQTGVLLTEAAKNRLLLETAGQEKQYENLQHLASAVNYLSQKDPSLAAALQTQQSVLAAKANVQKEYDAADREFHTVFRDGTNVQDSPEAKARFEEITRLRNSSGSLLTQYNEMLQGAASVINENRSPDRQIAINALLKQFPSSFIQNGQGNVVPTQQVYPGTRTPVDDTKNSGIQTSIQNQIAAGLKAPLDPATWMKSFGKALLSQGVPKEGLQYFYNKYSTDPLWTQRSK